MRAFLALLLANTASALAPGSEVTVNGVRLQALSPTLLRVEPQGPKGFEDRSTFMVVNRSHPGAPLSLLSSTKASATLQFGDFTVAIDAKGEAPGCADPMKDTDIEGAVHSPNHPAAVPVKGNGECCALCEADELCSGWVLAAGNCSLLASYGALKSSEGKEFGCASKRCGVDVAPKVTVKTKNGDVLYSSEQQPARNLLHWPAPLAQRGFALVDFPRFFVPQWAVAPVPQDVHLKDASTHGYDFTNNVNGDTYIFLLGNSVADWEASRKEFLQLTGPVPLLPDYAYGTWFTWWHSYTEEEAKSDIALWEKGSLPLDIWALDMNWRKTEHGMDHFYNNPNEKLFRNFTEWFAFLREKRLRTYFNDHPFPVASRDAGGLQTSPEETAFRWQGLSEWMAKGLTFWWFDHNWAFSIPPPFLNTSVTDGTWFGLDNAVWGSHIYYTSVAYFDEKTRKPAGDDFYGRPMTLTKFAKPDWRPGMSSLLHQESPAHHRFPVWWTGDGVNLAASVETMVDAGIHDLKPFVHSDCGGDGRGSAVGLLRWTAHCVFGSILRFHGADHRPWTYGPEVEKVIKSYLDMRYKLMPSLIAAGKEATETGFPLVARCDMLFPEHEESSANRQYLFLKDLLVAPIVEERHNVSSRSIWLPPGDWKDAWSGAVLSGPKTMNVTHPAERLPLFHSQENGLMVLVDEPGARVEEQDWSSLTLEAFPSTKAAATSRSIVERGSAELTNLELATDGKGGLVVRIGKPAAGGKRAWVLRVHLRKGQKASSVTLDHWPMDVQHLEASADFVAPFGGKGTKPAPLSGPVAEVILPACSQEAVVEMQILEEGEAAQIVV